MSAARWVQETSASELTHSLHTHDHSVNTYRLLLQTTTTTTTTHVARARCPVFESRVAPPFHWVATSGKLFTHIASTVSQLQETGAQKGSFRHLSGYSD